MKNLFFVLLVAAQQLIAPVALAQELPVAAMELWYIVQGSKVSAMSRDILVKGIKACTVSFNQQTKQWPASQN